MFTITHGAESVQITDIQNGVSIDGHLTADQREYLALPDAYDILENGNILPAGALPTEGGSYTIEKKAPGKGAKSDKKPVKGKKPTTKKSS